MYTVDQVMPYVWDHQGLTIAMALICYSLGFLPYLANMLLQIKQKKGVFPLWTHAFYIGADFTFAVIAFKQWLEIGWLFWILLCIGNWVFIVVEIWSLHNCIKNERQATFGWYKKGEEVSKGYAWARALISYAIGIIFCGCLRAILGDPMVLIIFLLTSCVCCVVSPLVYERRGENTKGLKFLAVANLINITYAFMPAGIGYYSTLLPFLSTPWMTITGIVFVLIAAYGVYVAFVKLPKYEAAA
ncbi:MAG: hypothetical protein IJH83_02735 [Coriobacteriales bacterium]|nr:hypothetical protein [Coriobacteriales bacterium]